MTDQTAVPPVAASWRTPLVMLMLLAIANQLCFQTWFTLINNFAHGQAHFGGPQIGTLQTVREIPGLLSLLAVFVLLLMREQTLAYVSLVLLAAGTMATGYFPSELGLYATTIVFSTGFHYFETMNQSLALQWLPKAHSARGLGRLISAESAGAVAAFGLIYLLFTWLGLGFTGTYVSVGLLTLAILAFVMLTFPYYPQAVRQHQKLVLRPSYWLYYLLTFLEGARRQIFVVFASFMMVERFGFSVTAITSLFLANQVLNTIVAPYVGGLVVRFGERTALWLEYAGLAGVFTAYAFVGDPWVAAALYMIDNMFFGLSMASKTYFQKIADPADIAPTAAVAFSINHIAAVFLPVVLGLIWAASPRLVFLLGTAFALTSLALACLVPRHPERGREIIWQRPVAAAAE